MAIRTGYTKAELLVMARTITAQADALVAELPNQPLQVLALACDCDRCIDPDSVWALRRTPAPDLTTALVAQYLGGLGAMGLETDDDARFEARVMLTHVVTEYGRWVVQSSGVTGNKSIRPSHLSPFGIVECLFQTGVVPRLDATLQTQIQDYLSDVVRYCVAQRARGLDGALCFLSLFGGRIQDIMEEFQTGRPLRSLRFWTALARGHICSHQNHRTIPKDLHRWFVGMPKMDREYLLCALEEPGVERLMERFAFSAKDPGWLLYLSRLLEWREVSILATRYSEYLDGHP
ncbi:hypothetical protein [Halocynthiibacter namhaensis]|uniref:hypothetical protein n=1 Tax=Halocynthiibacter namhaensis TaxID=1290553 RepID=UPI00057975E7|nr:hypothetical protein [Halocynthiibacter namhaensis]